MGTTLRLTSRVRTHVIISMLMHKGIDLLFQVPMETLLRNSDIGNLFTDGSFSILHFPMSSILYQVHLQLNRLHLDLPLLNCLVD